MSDNNNFRRITDDISTTEYNFEGIFNDYRADGKLVVTAKTDFTFQGRTAYNGSDAAVVRGFFKPNLHVGSLTVDVAERRAFEMTSNKDSVAVEARWRAYETFYVRNS